MTFESEGLLIVAIYTWLPPVSYIVFSDSSGFVIAGTDENDENWYMTNNN